MPSPIVTAINQYANMDKADLASLAYHMEKTLDAIAAGKVATANGSAQILAAEVAARARRARKP
jgi:hypothetical protein